MHFTIAFLSGFTFSLKNISSEKKKKSHDTAFTEELSFLCLAEMLRNGSEEDGFENFGLPSWRSGVLGMLRKEVKSPK